MFAYSYNNPVNMVDYSGRNPIIIIGALSLATQEAQSLIYRYGPQISYGIQVGGQFAIDFGTEIWSGAKSITTRIIRTRKAYGNLQYASKYGFDTYSELRKRLRGTGLQAHHLVEQRLKESLGIINTNLMTSVAVTKAEHQVFTNAWRKWIPYGTNYRKLSKDMIWEAAQDIYNDYPKLLKAAKETIFNY